MSTSKISLWQPLPSAQKSFVRPVAAVWTTKPQNWGLSVQGARRLVEDISEIRDRQILMTFKTRPGEKSLYGIVVGVVKGFLMLWECQE